eukprot:CAMPEP_0204328348 /NCGR_PEP_ID=MMETSP0469-20131031/13295_1 /ASSEMBLY_ACC=CAM_ASM_000384 /TAXON_ID=2969 /ORGANISM="Oxyrrhis marina" /LENGTH=118 /DNA_ID=CAMNT_0051310723 /DNA_START=170 /DNA_END=523 /DNA_ORIENTATION=-
MPCYAAQCHAMLRNAMPCCAMLRHETRPTMNAPQLTSRGARNARGVGLFPGGDAGRLRAARAHSPARADLLVHPQTNSKANKRPLQGTMCKYREQARETPHNPACQIVFTIASSPEQS